MFKILGHLYFVSFKYCVVWTIQDRGPRRVAIEDTRARSCHRGVARTILFVHFTFSETHANARKSTRKNGTHEIAPLIYLRACSLSRFLADELVDRRAAFLHRLSNIAGINTLSLFCFILTLSPKSTHLS